MQIFKCSLVQFPIPHEECVGDRRARVKLVDNDHVKAMALAGETVVTSRVKMIDYESGILLTQNSIYLFGRTP